MTSAIHWVRARHRKHRRVWQRPEAGVARGVCMMCLRSLLGQGGRALPPPCAGRRNDRVAVLECRVRVAWSMVAVLLGWVALSLLPSL